MRGRERSLLGPGSRLLAGLWVLSLCACRASIEHHLLQASRGDSDSRREAIVRLGDLLAEKEASGIDLDDADREALAYIREVAERDPEAMNRMRAIQALTSIRSVDSSDVFLEALGSEYWGVRWEAAKALRSPPRPESAGDVARRLQEEPRPEVILDLVKTLAAIGGPEAEQGLLEVYLDVTGRYRDNRFKAWEALLALTGRAYEYDEYEKWRAYRRERFGGDDGSSSAPVGESLGEGS